LLPASPTRSSSDALIGRLLETFDEEGANEQLFKFLSRRLPKDLMQKVLELAPDLLSRQGKRLPWRRLRHSEEVSLRAAAHEMRLLNKELR
jgi:hypothetical protein